MIQIDGITIDESMLKNNTLVSCLCSLIACKRLSKKNSKMLESLYKNENISTDLTEQNSIFEILKK